MTKIKIGSDERRFEDADEGWINQQITRRRRDGENVCVRVTIHTDVLNMLLCTPTCGGGFGGCRPPNRHEKEVFDLWNQSGLNCDSFTGGGVVSFLKRVRRIF